MINLWLVIQQLDQQLTQWQVLNKKYGKPRFGWVKTIRTALGMTVQQLGHRLGVSHSRISQLEAAEVDDAVTLHALKKAAEAMNCELVYAIVPKDSLSLENIVQTQAKKLATESVARVSHSMALEAQQVKPSIQKKQIDDLAKALTEHISKKLWNEKTTTDEAKELAKEFTAIYKKGLKK